MSSLVQRNNVKKIRQGELPDEEWETHAIIRVPTDVAPVVDNFIETGQQFEPQSATSTDPNNRMHLKFSQDKRTGQLKIGSAVLDFVVQDLPCIIETYKTHDKTNVYKVADVSQMINCQNPPQLPDVKVVSEADRNDPEIVVQREKGEKLLMFPHGVTPPMKNVRRRRWRRTKKKKFMDAPQVEQEIKRLLRLDLEAVNIRWEVIDMDAKKPQKTAKSEE